MTLARPIRSVCLAICLMAPVPALASGLSIGTSELVSADALSGLAIDGFDPVAYFVDQRPLAGKAEFETTWRGATWRFANAANRDAFLADPDVFAPAFGGYDAEAITRGVTAGSDPGIFAIIADRLYLFRSENSRAQFRQAAIRQSAVMAWAQIEPRLLR
jgi:YHS domain-containing protein